MAVGLREQKRQWADNERRRERDLKIPKVKDWTRRRALEADDCEWLRTYIPSVFKFPFSSDQKLIVEEIGHCLEFGLTKCFAAPRHDGKTSIARYLTLKYSLQRVEKNGLLVPKVPLSLIINATGPKAGKSLAAIKQKLRARKGMPIFDDYPFECTVANYVAPAPARANNVTGGGRPIKVEWGAEHIILPAWEDEGFMGGMLAALGITSNEIQGFNLYDVRPRFAILDDLDDRDSLASVGGGSIAAKIETNIDENVAGLGGPGEPFGSVMLCTIPSRASVAFRYSDPKQKPSWSGVRLRKIKQWPEHKELWEQYMALRQEGKQVFDDSGRPIDKHGRKAHAFLLGHLDEMHLGAIVSNEHDFIRALLPDGSQTQVSALQNCYDYIADKGMDSFLTEYQNDPPEEIGPQESGITPAIVASRLSGLKQRELPDATAALVAFIDLGKYDCYWTVVAWRPEAIGFVVDYGSIQVQGMGRGVTDSQTIERAVLHGLRKWRDEKDANPYRLNSEPRKLDVVLVDSGDFTDAAYTFVTESRAPYLAAKGFGKGQGMKSFNPGFPKPGHVVGEGWYTQIQPNGVKLVGMDVDHWKQFCHNRFLTSTLDKDTLEYRPGTLSLFSPEHDKLAHQRYANHICAEIWVMDITEKGVKQGFVRKPGESNHYLDATAGCCCAGAMCGIRVVGETKPQGPRRTLGELAAAAKKIA